MRLTRSSMLEVLRQDYIRTARAKGASEAAVNYHHALQNAMLPVITVIGIEAAFLIGGLIVTETVFNIPGVARFLVEAIRWRDYPIVQNLVMFIAVVVVPVEFHRSTCSTRCSIRASGTRTRQGAHWPRSTTIPNCGAPARMRRTAGAAVRYLAQRYPLGAIGAVIMVVFVLAAVVRRSDLPLRSAQRPMPRMRWRAPSAAALAGRATSLGRDVCSRIIHGARISLAVGIGSTAARLVVRRR